MNYIDRVRTRLFAELPGLDPKLLDLYTLLAFTEGERVTLESVHNAWAVWRSWASPDHPSLVPFDELSPEVQEMDRQYAEAIARAAKECA
jgi:hypothetical protein